MVDFIKLYTKLPIHAMSGVCCMLLILVLISCILYVGLHENENF